MAIIETEVIDAKRNGRGRRYGPRRAKGAGEGVSGERAAPARVRATLTRGESSISARTASERPLQPHPHCPRDKLCGGRYANLALDM